MTPKGHLLVWSVLLVSACAPEKGSTSLDEGTPEVSLAEGARERNVVATVNGHPIYDDCVSGQASALDIDAKAALQQCIEFELLAKLAHGRYGTAEEVHEVQRRESVRALLKQHYEPTADEPDDIPEDWIRKNLWARREIKVAYVRPEYRVAAYALAKYRPKGPGKVLTPAHDAEMRALAEEWHAALGARTSITLEEFRALVTRVSGERKFDFVEKYNTPLEGRSVPEFAKALFDLKRPGDLSGVVKSKFGYFIIMLQRIMPEKNTSFEEALPDLQKKIYAQWAPLAFAQYTARLEKNAVVERHEENLAKVRLDIPSAFRIKR